jgi:hypothetical protein
MGEKRVLFFIQFSIVASEAAELELRHKILSDYLNHKVLDL